MCDNLSILSIFTVQFSHDLHICSVVDFLDSLVMSHPHQLSGLFHCTPPGQTYIVFIIDANSWETSKVSCSLGAHTFTHTRTHTCTQVDMVFSHDRIWFSAAFKCWVLALQQISSSFFTSNTSAITQQRIET